MSSTLIIIIIIMVLLACVAGYFGLAYAFQWPPFTNAGISQGGGNGGKDGNNIGNACNTDIDCGDDTLACCKGKCAKKVDGWCPGEGANAGAGIGKSCLRDTDCKNWGYGVGGTGVTCCPQKLNDPKSGICTEKKNLIDGGITCKYPRGTWLAAWDVPNASKLCLSGKTYKKGLGVYCA